MTRDEISKRIRNNLNDAGITYYSEEDVNDAIQDGYDEVAVYCECIEKNVELPFKNDTTFYDFSEMIPDYYRVTRIYSGVTSRWLDVNLERENLAYASDWLTANGSADSFIIKGPKYIGITNKQPQAVGSFKVWYKAQADILSNNSVPKINMKFQILLEHYGTADMLEQNQEFSKSQLYWAQYNKMLEDYRQKIQLLAKTDHIFARNQIVWR